jgi:hypothetical protein
MGLNVTTVVAAAGGSCHTHGHTVTRQISRFRSHMNIIITIAKVEPSDF